MNFFQRYRIFRKSAIGIMVLFFGMMLLVTVTAYSRRSGSTGLDMAKIQKIRYESKQVASTEEP
jgi:hypothetical protein